MLLGHCAHPRGTRGAGPDTGHGCRGGARPRPRRDGGDTPKQPAGTGPNRAGDTRGTGDTLGRTARPGGHRRTGEAGTRTRTRGCSGDTTGTRTRGGAGGTQRGHRGRGEHRGNRFPGTIGDTHVGTQVTRGQPGRDAGGPRETRNGGHRGGSRTPDHAPVRSRPWPRPLRAGHAPSRDPAPCGAKAGQSARSAAPSRRSAAATPLPLDQSAAESQPWSLLLLHAIGRCRRRGGAAARVGGSSAPTWFLQGAAAGSRTERDRGAQPGGSERGRAQRDRDPDRGRAGPVLAAMDPLRAQQLAAELEVEMMADMYNRMTQACHRKCVPPHYKESELSKGECVCLDRCVAKYLEVHERMGKKLTELSLQDEELLKRMQQGSGTA